MVPHKDPGEAREYRREYHRRLRERDPDYQKRQYRKHRAKRLAAKREAYYVDLEKSRERVRADYAKHAESRAARQRRYREANREKTNAEARRSYHRNKAKRRKAKRAYYERNYGKIYDYIQRWRERNPERELLYHAKRLLNEQVGIPIRDIPDELAEAKAQQIKLHRAAQGIEAGTGETRSGSTATPRKPDPKDAPDTGVHPPYSGEMK